MVDVHGVAEVGFEPVAEAFSRNFIDRGDVGAAVCVYRSGRPVVDLWAGAADREGRIWERDTLQLVFSSTKGATAVCAHLLVEQGKLDLDAPVARYWPEFAANGKADILVRWVLSHRAGLPAVEGNLTLADVLAWDPVVAMIASQAPIWEPGTRHGYHARSYGWIVGELVRRIAGKTLGAFFADEVARPLRLDFAIGLPETEEHRVAVIIPSEPADPATKRLIDEAMAPDTLMGRVLTGPSGLFGYNEMWNRRDVHAAEMPSTNGIGTARALARLYAGVIGPVQGIRLLSTETVARACEVQSDGRDQVLGAPSRFGLGFMLPPTLGAGVGRSSFGHSGAGGSLGFADPEAGVAFGYVMNKMVLGLAEDHRAASLVEAGYACID